MTLAGLQTSTQNRTTGGAFRQPVVILAILGLVVLAATLRRGPGQTPVALGRAGATPVSILRRDSAWYWVEQINKDSSRLVRATAAGMKVICSAEILPRYAVEDGSLAWSARQGGRWSIVAAAADGSGPRALWSGPEEPMGLTLSGGRIYWLQRVSPSVPDGYPLPPLSASLEVLTVPRDGGEVTSFARLWESEDAEVLGFHAGALYVAAYRRTMPGSLGIYRVTQGGVPAVRLVGESGNPAALLTRGGILYWLAPSQETPSAYCLRRLDDRNHRNTRPKVATLSDWLPVNGRLYETSRGVVYRDQEFPPALWPAGRQDVFPTPLPVPAGYTALAAGEDEMLLASTDSSFSNPTLYRMPLP